MLKKILSISAISFATLSLSLASAQAKTKPIVGFVYIGSVNDGGYTHAFDVARQAIVKAGYKTLYKENVPEGSKVKDVIEQMIDNGATIIVSTSLEFMNGTFEEAKENPNVIFLHASGYKTAKNMSTFFGKIYQPRFLAGLTAGLKARELKQKEIGFVGAFPIPEVIRNINAFTLGAQITDPGVKVKVLWSNSWYNPSKERSSAMSLLNQGIKVIGQYQDSTAVLLATSEKGGFGIGNTSDMNSVAPKAHLSSPMWNWGAYLVQEINLINDGKYKTTKYWGDLKDGIVDISPLGQNVTKGSAEIVAKYKKDIMNGSYKIFGYHTIKDQAGKVRITSKTSLSDKDLLGMTWFVNGVEGRTK